MRTTWYPADRAKTLDQVMWAIAVDSRWKSYAHELRYYHVTEVGELVVGFCVWSASANAGRDIHEIVAYVGLKEEGNKFRLLATEASSNDLDKISRLVPSPLPKEKWWHRRQYKHVRVFQLPTPQESLLSLQQWAERRIGISQEQQELITQATGKALLRGEIMRGMDLVLEDQKLLSAKGV
jgi:hypothetical protein